MAHDCNGNRLPIFSQRHYEELAHFAGRNLRYIDCLALADWLGRENPAFKRARFLAACACPLEGSSK